MKKSFNRHTKELKIIFFKKGKNIIYENLSFFVKKYKVHKIIRLLNSDFKLIKKNMNKFMHFSIQNTGHKPGKNYLIVKIVKRGYFDRTIYKPPIFDSKNFILTKCISVQNNVHYADLKKNVFKHSLSNIKNIYALKKKYKQPL
tara:strand:+ start:52 stop:483 length:432 start_codon:yes stop_codon:yes gene_type:complete